MSLLLALTMLTGLIPSVYAAGPEPDVLTGTVEYYSTAKEERVTDEYTYSDAWFFEDPNERNDALAWCPCSGPPPPPTGSWP